MSKLKTILGAAAIVTAGATSSIAGVCGPDAGDMREGIQSRTSIVGEAQRFVGNAPYSRNNSTLHTDWGCCVARFRSNGSLREVRGIMGEDYRGQRLTTRLCKQVLGL